MNHKGDKESKTFTMYIDFIIEHVFGDAILVHTVISIITALEWSFIGRNNAFVFHLIHHNNCVSQG